MRIFELAFIVVAAFVSACGTEEPPPAENPFVVEVVSFTPGANAGFGQDRMPDIVFGPPQGAGVASGGRDVLSLGTDGSIVVRLGRPIVDGDGADFLVFENAFVVNGGPALNAEAGAVSVSADGETFAIFPCDPAAEVPNGCAGYGPVIAGSEDVDATDPATAGGDAFDLADVGLKEASFVRIVDAGNGGGAPFAGFDLDAIASVHE